MTPATLYVLTGIVLFGLGLHGSLAHESALRRLIALNVMSAGIFLVLVALALRPSGAPDPVPHAMVLTGLVVSVSATGLALGLIRRLRSLGDDAGDTERDGG